MRNFGKLFFALFAFAMCAAVSAEARSIESVSRRVTEGKMFLDVTFDAGETGDNHALYIAYDTEDKGVDISDWAELQRGCNISVADTSAEIPVSPLLTEKGYTFCRVFLTTSKAPYDTLIESLRQSGSQYIDTGIYPDGTTVAVMDTKFDSNKTKQQRFFGVSSDKTSGDYAEFTFDTYINGDGKFASACKNGIGDWKAAGTFTSDRVQILLSAVENHHVVITNLETETQIADKTYATTCTKISKGSLFVFAQNYVTKDGSQVANIAKGAYLYSFTMTKDGELVCDYKPCKLGDRVGVYDAVTDTVIYSASGTDFDAANSGSPVACSLLAGETQLAAAPSATGLFFDYTWRGTAENWGGTDAWTKEGDPATWVEGNNAIFATANSAARLAADVSANSIAFSADATVAGTGELTVKSVSVDSGVSAAISAPISSAFEKTGAGVLTLTQDRTTATIVKEGTLKMDGATIADLTLGTDGGAPVTFDYGGQELVKNAHGLDYLVTGSTVMLTNGIFSTASGYDLNIRDDTFTMPSVLTIAKDAVVRQGAIGKSVYIVNVNGTATINVIGGTLGNTDGCDLAYLQHKSPDGGLNLNVSEGGLVYFPCQVYALCRGDIAATSPSLYMTFANSAFSVGTKFQFGSSWSKDSYVPTAPTGVFAATNSVVSVGDGFIVGRNNRDSKTAGSLTVDFENCVVTAKMFAVYYDRPLNNARFNGTRFVFGAESGSFAASDDAANWITVGDDGLTLDTQAYSATLNANLGGSGAVTKVGAGTLNVNRDQTTTGGFNIAEGTLTINGNKTFAGPVEFAAGSTLNITSYNGTTPLRASTLTLPAEGTVALTLNGGVFDKGVYAICFASGVTAADGAKFAPSTGDLDFSWSVSGDKLVLTVGDVSGNYWTGLGGDGRMSIAANWLNGVPAAGEDIDLSFVSSATTIIADTGRAFGAVTMGDGVITFTNALTVAGFSDPMKVAVDADSTVTIDGDVTLDTAGQKLCKTVAAGGTLRITGVVEISHSFGEVKAADLATNGAGAPGTVAVEGGIAVKTGASVIWNVKTLALGASGMSFTEDAPFYFSVDDAEVHPLGVSTALGTAGKGKFRSKYDDVFLCATQYGSDQPAEITFDGFFDGVDNYWGHWRATGCGRVVCTSAVKSDRGLRVNEGATLAFNSNIAAIGISGQSFDVAAGGMLEIASSGTVTLTGNPTLSDGAALSFNFTDWNTTPQLALSNGKLTASGAVNVKISGEVWPKGGEKILTTCGGFNAEGVTVSLITEGAPKWAKGVYVNTDGNIVLDVKPRGTMVIVR